MRLCNILSMYDTVNHRTAYQLYSIYTGLLRGAKYMDVRITDTVTGEVLYEERQTNIRKAYSGGSTTASAANVLLELSPLELGLANNRKYQFEMSGVMDRVLGQGDYPEKREEDSFSFTFYVDNEAPELVDYRVRFDPYKDGKETKYKVYLDMDIYDNHYAQSVALCYLNNDEMQLELLSGDWIPVESTRGGTTTVSVDITDYYDSDIDMYIQVDDYAMNTHAYHLTNWKTLAEAVVYPESITVNDGDVTMNIGEAKELSVSVTPADAAATNLYWTSSNEKVVRVQNGELYGVGTGTATVTVYGAANTATQNKTSIKVTVTDQVPTEQIRLESLKLGLIRNKDGAMVDPTSMCDVHPNTTYVLQVSADPWYFPGELDIRFSSSAPDVASVDEKTGVVHTLREGTAYITAAQYVDGKESAFSVTAKLNVGPEFEVLNGYLRGYHGLGGKVTIPKSLNVYYIYEDAFKDNNNITEPEISSPCMEIQAGAFSGMTALKRVILPQSVTFVGTGAFRDCTALERVDLRSRAITFSTACFSGCTSLRYINNLVVTDTKVDTKTANILDLTEAQFTRTSPQIGTLGTGAFNGCTALTEADLTQLRVSGTSVFSNCTALERVTLSSHTVLGAQMFEGCEKLTTLTFTDTDKFPFALSDLPFSGGSVKNLEFANGKTGEYYLHTDGCYYTDSTLTTLVFAKQDVTTYTAPDSLRTILPGAFAGNHGLRTVSLGNVTSIGAYAFADTGLKYADKFLTVPASVREIGEGVFYNCYELEKVNFYASVEELPAHTFDQSALSEITLSASVRRLGDAAFRYTEFRALDLTGTSVKELGDRVFAYCYRLETIKLPALTRVGTGTFFYAPDASYASAPSVYPLASVSFAPGTTDIGTATFYSYSGFSKLTEISLPDSVRQNVTVIGENTFRGCSALTKLNLGKLTEVGSGAFKGCAALEGLDTSTLRKAGNNAFDGCVKLDFSDLSHVETIGRRAFAGTALTTADLSACTLIGAEAFADTALRAMYNANRVRTYGDHAFLNTALEGTFTFPASLASEIGAIGKGLFVGTKVKELALAGQNTVYSVTDGVLFSVLPNGKTQLESYPPEKSGTAYKIPDGVVRVQDEAFRSAALPGEIIFPDSILAIGDKAFYGCTAKTYRFEGLDAPVLETYIANVFANDAQKQIFSTASGVDRTASDAKAEEKYYANFSDYAALVLYPELSGVESLGLRLIYPANAAGFETRIWKLFFADTEKSDIIPEPDTKAAIDAINAMPTVEAIQALTSMTDKDAAMKLLAEYKALVSAARIAYNRVANADQRAFITNADVLFRTETVMRETRKAMGETVTIRDLQVKVSPNKLVYTAGELFDATGMVLTVIYDDGSEEDVTSGFVLPQTPLRAGQQTVTFTYAGIEKEISLTVNRGTESETTGNDTEETTSSPDETTAPDESTDSSDTSEETGDAANTGCGKGCGSVMASALTLPLLAAAAFAVLRIRKKEEEEEI